MHSAWFSRAEVERMMRDGEITDAQSIAALPAVVVRALNDPMSFEPRHGLPRCKN